MRIFLSLVILQLINLIFCVPDRCGNGVKHPYPGDNTKFIICENHIPLAKKCPVGMTFNQNVQVCDTLGNSGNNDEMVSGSYRTISYSPNPSVLTTQQSTGQTGRAVVYGTHNYDEQTPSNNDFDGNRIDQSLGSGHNNQHLSGSGQSTYHTSSYSTSNSVSSSGNPTKQKGNVQGIESQYNGQGLKVETHSGYSGSGNNLGYNGISSGNNQHYSGTSQLGYRGVTPSYSSGDVVTSAYNNGVSSQDYGNQYDNRHNIDVKKHKQHNGGIGGSYNYHKNTNSDSGLWLQHQNHGLDQSHINLNEIRGSTGHSAKSCDRAKVGDHIAYPGDCTKFIVCMEDVSNVVKDCPPKTHFNPTLQICDWPESAGCAY